MFAGKVVFNIVIFGHHKELKKTNFSFSFMDILVEENECRVLFNKLRKWPKY